MHFPCLSHCFALLLSLYTCTCTGVFVFYICQYSLKCFEHVNCSIPLSAKYHAVQAECLYSLYMYDVYCSVIMAISLSAVLFM